MSKGLKTRLLLAVVSAFLWLTQQPAAAQLTSSLTSESPRLGDVRLEVSCAAAGCWVSHRKALTTASRSLVFNPLLIVQLLVVGRNCFRNYFRNQFRNHFSALHPTFESGNH